MTGPNQGSRLKRAPLVALSLVPTPLLLFVSSSTTLYLKNQTLLQYQRGVLIPFGKLFILTFFVGVLLYLLSRYRLARYGIWIYYLAGPVFMLFSFARYVVSHLPFLSWLYETPGGLAFWPCLLLGVGILLGFRRAAHLPLKGFAIFGAILIVSEIYLFYDNRVPDEPPAYWEENLNTEPGALSLPNIYHIIMDGYQIEVFEMSLTDDDKNVLGGFVFFSKNTSMYHTTTMSLASVFSGRPYLYDRTRNTYVNEAFGSENSFLHWLKHHGYTTLAYVPADWSNWLKFRAFDRMVFLRTSAAKDLLEMNTTAFWNLWLFANTTGPLREWLIRSSWFSELNEEDLGLLRRNRLFPQSMPIVSYLGFQNVLEKEKELPDSNHYTLIHLLIPHSPYKLRADCSYVLGQSRTGLMEQYGCAMTLLKDFIHLLKSLNRFDDSVILVHGDHGGPYRVSNGALKPTRSRSLRTVLLIKPPGRTERDPFTVSDAEVTLLDIGPTLKGYLQERTSQVPTGKGEREPSRPAR